MTHIPMTYSGTEERGVSIFQGHLEGVRREGSRIEGLSWAQRPWVGVSGR